MRVALDGLLLGGAHSGVERAIESLAQALPEAAPQHQYLLACLPRYRDRGPLTMPRLCAPWWVRGRGLRILYEQGLLSRALRGRCDLLHGPGYVLPHDWTGPSVLTVYDLIALRFPQFCTAANVWHYRYLLPLSLRRATRVVAPSQAVADDLAGRFPEIGDRVRVIPLGIPEGYAPATDEAVARLRERLGLPERFILYVGNLEPKKNLPAIIAAFDRLAEALPHGLVLAGRRAWGAEAVDRAVAAARHRGRIRVTGYVAEADLPALYTAAAVLVQWSHYEGLGLPPLEAMVCGTPVVVSDGGALPETVGEAGVVVPLGPPEQLAEALAALLADETRLTDLRRRGLAHAARFTWREHGRQVAAVYEEIADARH